MIHYLTQEHSIADVFMSELRDARIQQDRARFRRNLERLGEIFAYEISKTFQYEAVSTETPLGIATTYRPLNKVILATILRAGLPLHQGLVNYFDNADNGFISTFRKHHKDGTFEVSLEYSSCPSVDDSTLIISDPMLATGSSMLKAIEATLERSQPKELHIVCVIASTYGVNYTKRLFPDAHLWIGAQDEELTAKSYIVPGLGDAGDLAFGGKNSE